ncbi:MAG: hypothetical protein RL228_371 [Actinomycetota bacterium]|jgi:hypothetical protein
MQEPAYFFLKNSLNGVPIELGNKSESVRFSAVLSRTPRAMNGECSRV